MMLKNDFTQYLNVAAIEKLQNDYLNTVAKLKSNEETLDYHRATIRELNQALSEKAKEINELKKQVEYYKVTTEKVNSLIIEVDIYKNKIKELEYCNSEQSKIIESYANQVEDLQKQVEVVEKVKKDRDDLAFKLTNRVAEVVNLKNKITHLTEERDAALLKASLLRGAENQLHSNASAYGQVKTENGVLRNKLQEYLNEIKDLKLKLYSATAYENERKSEVDLLKKKVEDLESLVNTSKQDLLEGDTALAKTIVLFTAYKRKNKKLKNALNKSIADFSNYISKQKGSNNG